MFRQTNFDVTFPFSDKYNCNKIEDCIDASVKWLSAIFCFDKITIRQNCTSGKRRFDEMTFRENDVAPLTARRSPLERFGLNVSC